jgi:hypothetical protein
MDSSEKITFNLTLGLTVVIIIACLIIFILTPSPISPTRLIFGYISSIYTKGNTLFLNFDPAKWLTDSNSDFSASSACVKDGNCPECSLPITKSCVPNGYYIFNPDQKIVVYPVAPFAKVGTLILNPDWNESDPESKPYKTISLSQFQEIFLNPDSSDNWIKTAPYDITAITGRVIIINQHYIP